MFFLVLTSLHRNIYTKLYRKDCKGKQTRTTEKFVNDISGIPLELFFDTVVHCIMMHLAAHFRWRTLQIGIIPYQTCPSNQTAMNLWDTRNSVTYQLTRIRKMAYLFYVLIYLYFYTVTNQHDFPRQFMMFLSTCIATLQCITKVTVHRLHIYIYHGIVV